MSICKYEYTHIYIYTYIYVCILIYTYTYTYISRYACICKLVNLNIIYIYICIQMVERKMLCEKCVILFFVVVYAVHCFGSIVKKIVGCSSNFLMMMLYYIDMCVCVCLFVCSRLCCFSLFI